MVTVPDAKLNGRDFGGIERCIQCCLEIAVKSVVWQHSSISRTGDNDDVTTCNLPGPCGCDTI